MEEEKYNEQNKESVVTSAGSMGNPLFDTFGEIPEPPTQEAIDGILFDFNYGLRVKIPKNGKSYRIKFSIF